MVNDPLTQYMFCSPDEGAAAVVLCRADSGAPVHATGRSTCGRRSCAPGATAPSRCTARGPRSSGMMRPRSTPRGRPTRWPASVPRTSTSIQLQDTDAGAEVIHMAENGFCKDGEQEALIADGRDRDRRQPAGQHRRRPHRQRRADRRLGAPADPRARAPAARRRRRAAGARGCPAWATRSSTARPARPAWPSSRPERLDLSVSGRGSLAPARASPGVSPAPCSSIAWRVRRGRGRLPAARGAGGSRPGTRDAPAAGDGALVGARGSWRSPRGRCGPVPGAPSAMTRPSSRQ